MGTVNRYAKGLLSVLDSQTQGDTPSSMGTVIAPAMEMLPFLIASKRMEFVHNRSTGPVTGFGAIPAILTVPEGELWFVYFASCSVISTDVLSGQVVMSLQAGNPTGPNWLSLGQTGLNAFSGLLFPSQRSCSAAIGPVPLILQSGEVIQANVELANDPPTGTGWNATVSAGILRMSQ